MDDLIAEFVTETSENLAVLDQELVRFEQSPKDKDILSNIFRMMHTIKGTCGFLGLPRLEKVAHAGEDVLGRFRDGTLDPTPGSVTLILKCIDQIRAIVDHLAETSSEGSGDDSQLIGELKAILEQPATAPGNAPDPGPQLSAEGFPVAAELLAEVEAASSAPPPSTDAGFPVAAELLAEFEQATKEEARAAAAPPLRQARRPRRRSPNQLQTPRPRRKKRATVPKKRARRKPSA